MRYETAQAFRMALERSLLARSNESGVSLDRLRRRVLFERIVARLQAAEPGRWVVKGGMALEVRLHDDARLTKDIDMGLRDDVGGAAGLRDRLIEALSADLDHDGFVLISGPLAPLSGDGAGQPTWRVRIEARLAGPNAAGQSRRPSFRHCPDPGPTATNDLALITLWKPGRSLPLSPSLPSCGLRCSRLRTARSGPGRLVSLGQGTIGPR